MADILAEAVMSLKEQDANFEACEAEEVVKSAGVYNRTLRHDQSTHRVQLLFVSYDLRRSLGGAGTITGHFELVLDGVMPMLVSVILHVRGEGFGLGADRLSGRRIASRHDADST